MDKIFNPKEQYFTAINNILSDVSKIYHKDILDFILNLSDPKYTETNDATLVDISTLSIEHLAKLVHFLKSFK